MNINKVVWWLENNRWVDMYRYGVVVIGYKNKEGIKRLLTALGTSDYDDTDVCLIISIDKSENDSVTKIANEFQWRYGEKRVITYKKRMGLRNHVLRCGDYLNTYNLDAIAVFEDDIFPSCNFFRFMKRATEKYIENENIAGISLYTHCINFNTKQRFVPVLKKYHNYFFQCAQSWGQVWFRNQWNEFRNWYKEQGKMENDSRIPQNVVSWPETSWLKYHIKYCIERNKYFVYPYTSYTTCFSDIGEHIKTNTDEFQVSLFNDISDSFNFMELNDDALKYDAFFENQELYKYCKVDQENLLVDLYGDHIETNKRYVLTTRKLPYRIVHSWGNRLIPHEMNLIHNIQGNDIVLYDLGDVTASVTLPKREVAKNKMEVYFNILERWMELEESGYNIQDYFVNNEWRHIAIYGIGKIGMHLYKKLKNTLISVDYFIDRNSNERQRDIKIINPEEQLPFVDVVVVTPVMEFEQIKKNLESRGIKNVVSIDSIFFEVSD